MTEKKRLPPWEQARLNFTLKERERLRKVKAKDRPSRERVMDLEENRKRLAEIKKRLEVEEKKDAD
jgi:hypothetical protein